MSKLSVICALVLLSLSPGGSRADQSYFIAVDGVGETSSVPFSKSASGVKTGGFASTLFLATGAAGKGFVAPYGRAETTWDLGFTTGATTSTQVSATTDDFIITGPGSGQVNGTIYFRARASFFRQGGHVNHGGHGGSFFVRVQASSFLNLGLYNNNNALSSGNGVFTGQSGDAVDVVFSITGNFPINSPFAVTLYTEAIVGTYGNNCCNTGIVTVDGGGISPFSGGPLFRVGDASGQVMSLPAGYTVNSANWQIVGNQVSGVEEEAPWPVAARLQVFPNPFAKSTRLAVTAADEFGGVLEIFDLLGRRVRAFESLHGSEVVTWDGRDDGGNETPDGIYFVVLKSSRGSAVQRVVRTR